MPVEHKWLIFNCNLWFLLRFLHVRVIQRDLPSMHIAHCTVHTFVARASHLWMGFDLWPLVWKCRFTHSKWLKNEKTTCALTLLWMNQIFSERIIACIAIWKSIIFGNTLDARLSLAHTDNQTKVHNFFLRDYFTLQKILTFPINLRINFPGCALLNPPSIYICPVNIKTYHKLNLIPIVYTLHITWLWHDDSKSFCKLFCATHNETLVSATRPCLAHNIGSISKTNELVTYDGLKARTPLYHFCSNL